MKELLTMFRSGTAAFFKQRMLHDFVCLVDRLSEPDTFPNDSADLEEFAFSDSASIFSDTSQTSEDDVMSEGYELDLLDEMDEVDEEGEEDYEDEEDEGEF